MKYPILENPAPLGHIAPLALLSFLEHNARMARFVSRERIPTTRSPPKQRQLIFPWVFDPTKCFRC